MYQRSSALFKAAQKVIPGGVNSPVRAFKAVGGNPIFVEKAQGAYLYDVDGNTLIDEDRVALKDAQSNYITHMLLLKTRLLYDGGYYSLALLFTSILFFPSDFIISSAA